MFRAPATVEGDDGFRNQPPMDRSDHRFRPVDRGCRGDRGPGVCGQSRRPNTGEHARRAGEQFRVLVQGTRHHRAAGEGAAGGASQPRCRARVRHPGGRGLPRSGLRGEVPGGGHRRRRPEPRPAAHPHRRPHRNPQIHPEHARRRRQEARPDAVDLPRHEGPGAEPAAPDRRWHQRAAIGVLLDRRCPADRRHHAETGRDLGQGERQGLLRRGRHDTLAQCRRDCELPRQDRDQRGQCRDRHPRREARRHRLHIGPRGALRGHVQRSEQRRTSGLHQHRQHGGRTCPERFAGRSGQRRLREPGRSPERPAAPRGGADDLVLARPARGGRQDRRQVAGYRHWHADDHPDRPAQCQPVPQHDPARPRHRPGAAGHDADLDPAGEVGRRGPSARQPRPAVPQGHHGRRDPAQRVDQEVPGGQHQDRGGSDPGR